MEQSRSQMDNTIPVTPEAAQPILIKYFDRAYSTVRQDTWLQDSGLICRRNAVSNAFSDHTDSLYVHPENCSVSWAHTQEWFHADRYKSADSFGKIPHAEGRLPLR